MIGKQHLKANTVMEDYSEPKHNRYAEEPVLMSKAGVSVHLSEQSDIIGELIKVVKNLEEHLGPITVSHPMRDDAELSGNGDSEVVNLVRINNRLLVKLIERINDIQQHTQI